MNSNASFFTSRVVKGIVAGIIALAILLLVFWGGMSFGYQRALFSERFGQNYERNFLGPQTKFPGSHADDFMNSHGAAGQILSINGSIVSVKGNNGVEQSVSVATTTAIERSKDNITIKDLHVDDFIIVIGEPDASGQIDARLIRVIPAPMDNFGDNTDQGLGQNAGNGQAQGSSTVPSNGR